MKLEEIKELFEQFKNAAAELEGKECWSARDLIRKSKSKRKTKPDRKTSFRYFV